jgi:penicillin G amidase
MRLIPFLVSLALTVTLILLLNNRWGDIPPLGRFLSPQTGFWQNAEPVHQRFSGALTFPQLKAKAEVYFDDRLVPHIFAEDQDDAYFIVGYLHAKFRLWQMDFLSRVAAGRLSEILGDATLEWDRSMRRQGMVYSSEHMVQAINKNPASKAQLTAYAAGVNAFMEQLSERQLPLEFKLLDYEPEEWDELKTALATKLLSFDLTGYSNDPQYSYARRLFSREKFNKLFPVFPDSLRPVVPNTLQDPYPQQPAIDLTIPSGADSLSFAFNSGSAGTLPASNSGRSMGSNSWVVGPSKTLSGNPILCNDPHLGMGLPSAWYEVQIQAPALNVYGVSYPGLPNVIIGFNDSIAFGFTNAERDVQDYYDMRFRDSTMREYWFNGNWTKATKRPEVINILGRRPFIDSVAYTDFGPLKYDPSFPAPLQPGKYVALRWKAHDPSDENFAFYLLNRAADYDQYLEAIKHLSCPALNCSFASRSGDIALWHQGEFPAKWKGQGDFIMPGTDSTYMWRGWIPQEDNPHMKNPIRGYVSSANQAPTDSTYPYYIGRASDDIYRGYIINRYLDKMQNITVEDMEKMQQDSYFVKAEFARPILLKTDESRMDTVEKKYFDIYKQWDNRKEETSKGATVFQVWWQALTDTIFADEFHQVKLGLPVPLDRHLLGDAAFPFIDNISTPQKETLEDQLLASLTKASHQLKRLEADGRLGYAAFKDTGIKHLLQLGPFSRLHLPVGGGWDVINATTETNHGPAWRMVVELGHEIKAYGIFAGGESGNPGSKYYDNFINNWAAGKYYPLWMMGRDEASDSRIQAKITFSN